MELEVSLDLEDERVCSAGMASRVSPGSESAKLSYAGLVHQFLDKTDERIIRTGEAGPVAPNSPQHLRPIGHLDCVLEFFRKPVDPGLPMLNLIKRSYRSSRGGLGGV